MAVFLDIEIAAQNLQMNDLNVNYLKDGTNARQLINALTDLLSEIQSGCVPATVQITSRTTTASIATSGTGSTQVSLNLK